MKILFLVLIMSIPTLARADLNCTFILPGRSNIYEIQYTVSREIRSRGVVAPRTGLITLVESLPSEGRSLEWSVLDYSGIRTITNGSQVKFSSWDGSYSVTFENRDYKSLRPNSRSIIGRAFIDTQTRKYHGPARCVYVNNLYLPLI